MATTVIQIRLALVQDYVDVPDWMNGGVGLTAEARESLLEALGSVGFLAEITRTEVTAGALENAERIGYLRD